jgi:hypothetical protein
MILGEPGDPSAPPGPRPWCLALYDRAVPNMDLRLRQRSLTVSPARAAFSGLSEQRMGRKAVFVVIRKYAAGAGADEVARRVGEGLVPVLRDLPGFRAYYAFVGEDQRPVSVSIVATRADAVLANRRVRDWVTANMADLIPEPPEITMGEMLVDAATYDDEAEGGRGGASDPDWVDGGV